MKAFAAKVYTLLLVALLSAANSSFAADAILSKQAVIEKSRSYVQGRVLAADLQNGNPPRYKVKVLQKNGRLKVLHLNANTGARLRPGKR